MCNTHLFALSALDLILDCPLLVRSQRSHYKLNKCNLSIKLEIYLMPNLILLNLKLLKQVFWIRSNKKIIKQMQK